MTEKKKRTSITLKSKQWFEEAHKRYPDKNFVFKCPVCGHRQSYDDYVKANAKPGQIGFICIGRLLPDCRVAFGDKHGRKTGPCNYTGGGLLRLNPIIIKFEDGDETSIFDFADDPLMDTWQGGEDDK